MLTLFCLGGARPHTGIRLHDSLTDVTFLIAFVGHNESPIKEFIIFVAVNNNSCTETILGEEYMYIGCLKLSMSIQMEKFHDYKLS